jgi:ribosomal protein L16 Arg81 hydroxylase
MANDEYLETRLVKQDQPGNWEVFDGPHHDFNFENKTSKWTLIVHNLNLYDQFCFDLEKGISSIPIWLFDDVLCTY